MKKMFSAYSDPNYDKIEVSFQIQFMKKKMRIAISDPNHEKRGELRHFS